MKNLMPLKNKISESIIDFISFSKNPKKGIYYFIDHWGIGLCIEYNIKTKYHIYHYPYINGKHVCWLNYDKNYRNDVILIPQEIFNNYTENKIRNNTNFPLHNKCIFKYEYKYKTYYESGIYSINEDYIDKETNKRKIVNKIYLDNTKTILNKKDILGWYPYFKFKKEIVKDLC
jgi:hypothetical protein